MEEKAKDSKNGKKEQVEEDRNSGKQKKGKRSNGDIN